MDISTQSKTPVDKIIKNLQEREKELNCLYRVEEILNTTDDVEEAIRALIKVIPAGCQYPEYCQVSIRHVDQEYHSPRFWPTEWVLRSSFDVEGKSEGEIAVYYREHMPLEYEGPFLKEERKLLDNIAERLGKYILHQRGKKLMDEWQTAKERITRDPRGQWQVIVDLLRRTDHELFLYVSRKMTYYLCWNGVKDAQALLQTIGASHTMNQLGAEGNMAAPGPNNLLDLLNLATQAFDIAAQYLNDDEMLANVQRWVQESRINFLVKTVDNHGTSLLEIADTLRRFHHVMPDPSELPIATQKTVNSILADRFLTSQLEFIRVAKDYIDVNDMHDILQRTIYSTRSLGRLGGKSARLLLASRILHKLKPQYEALQPVKIPKTWYITSDVVLHFIYANNLEEVVEQKYKPIEQIRLEYPHIIQIFKNSPFPLEIIKGLSMALDDFGNHPLIVRSSSLLEDRLDPAFSGKYKSVFLANQGSKQERLEALTDAIAEVYASLFGPDPIEYQSERGLLDFHEEMGVMIQEAVGVKVGPYFLPSYAGVAFSRNEFRWSPRIKREDGLIRLVPGLGTRAVHRSAADYPILIAPGQPNLPVNATIKENVRYAPKKVDVIHLEHNRVETLDVDMLIKAYGDQIPAIHLLVSVLEPDRLSAPGIMTDFAEADVIVTFEQLRTDTRFVDQIHTMLNVLEEVLQTPVHIEFASDGADLYLLQCRPQIALSPHDAPPMPQDVAHANILFSANKFVSNGYAPAITHIVYIDPQTYQQVQDPSVLVEIGRAVRKLNTLLPKRQFMLIVPGYWDSYGDRNLGVNVTYADIHNTAALIEIAMKQRNSASELSFGAHFFQDLVEASIRYLPLYPGEKGSIYNHEFFTNAPNVLAQIVPECAALSHVVKLIDVPGTTHGQVVRLVMNADLDQALAYFDTPSAGKSTQASQNMGNTSVRDHPTEEPWRWRLKMATHIASQLDPDRFGAKGFYVIGSTKNATARQTSDIDVVIHIDGTEQQQRALQTWLEGWSLCLDEVNYRRTGYRTGGLLDVHFVTDEDIRNKTSFAGKIGAATDAAHELPMMKK